MSKSTLKNNLIFVGVAVSYFLLGWSGLELATINLNTSPIWFPSGLAVASIFFFGMRVAPAIFLGALLTNLTVDTPTLALISIAIGNMIEAIVGAKLLHWLLGPRNLSAYSEFIALALSAIIASAVSASMGATSLYLLDAIQHQDFIYTWYTWWSGDAIGILILTPFLIEFSKRDSRRTFFENLTPKIITAVISFSLLVLVFRYSWNQAWGWALTPLFLTAGVFLGDFFARSLLLAVSLTGVGLTALGYLPLEFGELNSNLIYLQTLLASYAFATIFSHPLRSNFEIGRKLLLGPALGWLTVFTAVYIMSDIEQHHLEKDYAQTMDYCLDEIVESADKYQLMLSSAGSYMRQTPELNGRDWKEYYDSIGLVKGKEGILGLGVIREVQNNLVPGFLAKQKISLVTIDQTFASGMNNSYIINYVEPMDRNFPAVGLDIGSEFERRTAAEKSRALRKVVSTGPIRLAQDFEKREGVLLLNPVWDQKNSFLGWTYAPVITQDYFAFSLNQFSPLVNLSVQLRDRQVYRNSPNSQLQRKPLYSKTRRFQLFDQEFTISFYPTDLFFKRHFGGTPPLALLMNLFMLFISGLILEQLSFANRAENLIRQRSRELESSKLQLIQSSKLAALGKMASGVAHEINNPLTIITMKVQVLTVMLEELKINHQPLLEEVKKITSTVHRLGNIVKGLKTYSRLSQDDPYEWLSLGQILQETLDLCIERMKNSGIELRLGTIPSVSVLSKPGQLSQVFINLMNNAIDALESAPEKWISFAFSVEKTKVRIVLTDSGPGIPEAVRLKIMEPFFTTKPFGKGTGLGLSIARDIVEDHGGILWLNQGHPQTSFVIELPIQGSAV